MNYRILILGIFTLFMSKGFSSNLNDTINVMINLKQVDSLGLKVNVYPPNDLNGNVNYQFPISTLGIYEYLNSLETIINLSQQTKKINCIENSFNINCDLSETNFTYNVKSTVNKIKGMSAEDVYYLKDSIYILNWHYLVGFFQTETKRPYKITITKNVNLLGTGSLPKKVNNDSTDIYIAGNYKELLHSPIMYSIPDTISFRINKTNFTISCAGKDSLLNTKKIKDLLTAPLTTLLKESYYQPDNYSFLFYSDYSLTTPYLTGLEHPFSTLICYHSALLDTNILISSSIHEFIHAIYAPLRIRSEVINNFDFKNPKCDELLWFYEGVTEYLTIRTLTNTGFFSRSEFLGELNESNKYHKNINLSKVSANIYNKKEQKLFDNFYTKGSLFAFQLDVEIIKLSNGKTRLADIMSELQKLYNSETPFNSDFFIKEFSTLSGLDLQEFISKNVRKKTKVNFLETVKQVGYNQKLQDTLIWTYNPKKVYLILNYKKNRLEYSLVGSIINKEQNSKKVTIYSINEKPLTWFNYNTISSPNNEKEIQFKANIGEKIVDFRSKPIQILKEKHKVKWIKNKNIDSDLAKFFWNE